MGHHITERGEFRSDKHPNLPPDRIRLNLRNPRSERALRVLAEDYEDLDPELAADLRSRLDALHGPSGCPECRHRPGHHLDSSEVSSRD